MGKYTAILAAAILLSACQSNKSQYSNSDTQTFDTTMAGGRVTIHMETQKLENGEGYGYIIAVNGKKMIAQNVIPVVEGNQAFKTAGGAFAIGRTAARRMAITEGLPSITFDDLLKEGIVDKEGRVINN